MRILSACLSQHVVEVVQHIQPHSHALTKTVTLHRAMSHVTPHLTTPSTRTPSLSSTLSSSHVLHPPLSEHKTCGDQRPHLRGAVAEPRPLPGFLYKRARDVAHPAHLGALIAAMPRILDMIRGATIGGLLPEQPVLARPSAPVESAIAALLDALDDSERPTAWLTQQCQKSSRAAPLQRSKMTTPSPRLPHPGKVVSVHHCFPTEPDCDA